MHGILEKLSANKNGLRTNTIEGNFDTLPVIGARFEMFAEPLNPDAFAEDLAAMGGGGISFRWVTTSSVVALEEVSGGYEFRTESGTEYRVKEHSK